MDNPHLIVDLDLPKMAAVSRLEDRLWPADAMRRRSRELTPLYVQRYAGVFERHHLSRHPFWELIFVFGGGGFLQGRTTVNLQPGTAVLMPPGVVHGEWATQRMDLLWMGLHGSRLSAAGEGKPLVLRHPELAAPMEQLWLRATAPVGEVGPELDGLALAVLARFLWLHGQSEPRADALADALIQHLRQHYHEPFSMARVAEKMGYSPGYLYRAFHRRTGKTPLRYLTEVRMETALAMMRQSTLPLHRIAHLVGYQDPLYFSRVFRRMTGRAPKSMSQRFRVPGLRGAGV